MQVSATSFVSTMPLGNLEAVPARSKLCSLFTDPFSFSRHCGGKTGKKKGLYFPTSKANLQGCTPTLYRHLISCEKVPKDVISALERAKCTHKMQAVSKQGKAQKVFFSRLWERIHDAALAECPCARPLVDKIHAIVEQSDAGSQHISLGENGSVAEGDVDFHIALDLLNRPPTPNSSLAFLEEAPDVDIAPTSVTQPAVVRPVVTKISSIGERYQSNGLFVVLEYGLRSYSGDTPELTRKFSREAEILLIRGMLKYGKQKCWKKM